LRRDRKQFHELHAARRPSYITAALCIETGGKDVDAVAAEVAANLDLRIR